MSGLELESAVGRGSRFSFALPAFKDVPAEAAAD